MLSLIDKQKSVGYSQYPMVVKKIVSRAETAKKIIEKEETVIPRKHNL